MKAIKTGISFKIYDDSMKTFNELPARSYIVRFDKMKGFYLDEYADIQAKEVKIYGAHLHKVQKTVRAYEKMDRNMGVILSGHKGTGKSLFAKLLSMEVVNNNIPVIVVDQYIPGIASYIELIDQSIMVLFDEFDKTFDITSHSDIDPQAELLGLFDGMSPGKKLFVITCNDIQNLTDFIINRPGRFHYHFRFDYPSADEIKQYLHDKLEKQHYDEIEAVIAFSRKVDLNYDCLRAIAFEINSGEGFCSAIKDLNIINLSGEYYNATIYFKNGSAKYSLHTKINFFENEEIHIDFRDNYGNEIMRVAFWTKDSEYDEKDNCIVFSADKLTIAYDEYYDAELVRKAKELVVDYLKLQKEHEKSLHYII